MKVIQAYLERTLERKTLAGSQVLDILPIDAETKLSLDKVLQGLRESNRGDFDVHEPSLSTQLTIIRHDQSHREVDLSWHPICAENGTIKRFLLTLTDVTVLRKLERSAREKVSELSKLNRYINEHVLQRFFPPDLVQDLVDGKANFDDRAKGMTITVLLTDLSSFTKATETLGPDRIATILNSYFIRMTGIAFAAGGTIDKFMGDGILILFGAPREMPAADQVNRACRCAQEMQVALDELNRTWDLGDIEDFHLRTAISHGPAIVGSFGGKKRSDLTAIGTTVNLAARISQISKPDEILVNREAAQYIPSGQLHTAGFFKLKGVAKEVELFRYKTADAEAATA